MLNHNYRLVQPGIVQTRLNTSSTASKGLRGGEIQLCSKQHDDGSTTEGLPAAFQVLLASSRAGSHACAPSSLATLNTMFLPA
jgi:hypothetical protein